MILTIKETIIPFAAALLIFFLLVIGRGIALRLLPRLSRRTESKLGEISFKAFRTPSIYWALAIALYFGLAISNLSARYICYLNKTICVVLIFSITTATANLFAAVFRHYIPQSQLPFPTTGIAYGIVKGFILTIGLLIILNVLGLSITPLLTALRVSGLAVALALQDTLSNLFAGIHILIEKSIRVGDFVRLETGQEGSVTDITWRTARIRTLLNSTVIIPNSKLSQTTGTNYDLRKKNFLAHSGEG